MARFGTGARPNLRSFGLGCQLALLIRYKHLGVYPYPALAQSIRSQFINLCFGSL
jgi:hypothetical protein